MIEFVRPDPPPFAPCVACDEWADGLLNGRPLCSRCAAADGLVPPLPRLRPAVEGQSQQLALFRRDEHAGG